MPRWPHRPDPKPLVTDRFLDLDLVLERGALRIARVKRGTFPKGPTRIKRFRGRFAALLFSHKVLIDVVRFDFPLTGGASYGAPEDDRLGQGLSGGVTARTAIRIPFDERVTRVTIADSRTDRRIMVKLPARIQPSIGPDLPRDLRTRSFGRSKAGEENR